LNIYCKKKLGTFNVVDVGGSMGGWSAPYVDAIIDFNDNKFNENIKSFTCDITNHNDWNEIFDYVHKNGKFDFCICTHTLEDIMNPVFVCEQICKISKKGYIAFPSKYRELARFEQGYNGYRGYIHHRWIFTYKNGGILSYPKINYIEHNNKYDKIADMSPDKYDLSFYWKNEIDIKYLNNNYLGPSVDHVISYYDDLINDYKG
jgi:hypothetical protein